MKKKRFIEIKNPRFVKLRNELRILLKMRLEDFRTSLRVKAMELSKKGDLVKSRQFQDESSRYDLMESLSILTCLICGHSNKNMVFAPELNQWLCIECYSEHNYYEKLRRELNISKTELREFFDRLGSEEGISVSKSGFRCQEYHFSKLILDRMGIIGNTQEKFFELCKFYGGYCDCEIIFNAKSRFLEE